MNSLTYLSRQFDVLASARTPPSTPTSDKAPLFSAFEVPADDSEHYGDNKLKRTQTWSKSFTQQHASHSDEETRSNKRSFSLPAFDVPLTIRKPSLLAQPTSSSSLAVERKAAWLHQRIRRLYLVRTFVVLWNAVYDAWRWVVRHGIARTRSHGIVIGIGVDADAEEATSVDEKDSEEEVGPLVTRTLPRPTSESAHQLLLVPFPESPSPSLADQSPHVPPTPSTPASAYVSLNLSPSSRIKSSSLLPNPFATSLLTQSYSASQPLARSPSPTPSLPSTPPSHPRKTPFHLPKTLVLDLDETLIHSTSRPLLGHGTGGTGLLGLGGRRNKGAGHMVEVVLGGRSTLYHVYKRPFVDYFLRKVRQTAVHDLTARRKLEHRSRAGTRWSFLPRPCRNMQTQLLTG